jgi:hypothetical protein
MPSDNDRSRTDVISGGDTMRNALGRLVLWMAEALDRSLLTVPDFDLDQAYPFAGSTRAGVLDGMA